MTKSREATEGLQASIMAITMMKEYDTPDTPTQVELENVKEKLDTANTKYLEAELAAPGEIDPDEFLKVVQNFASVLLDLGEFDRALGVLDTALRVPSLVAKGADINNLILTVAFSKANAITGADGDANAIIGAADIGLAIDDTDENLHYLKGLALQKKGEAAAAIAEFVHLKDSTTLGTYANNTVKSLLTELAIDAIGRGDTFQDFIIGKDIGNDEKDWLTTPELADSVASFARFKYAPTAEQIRDETATVNKPLGCILMNAVIGEHAGAQDTLHAMTTGSDQANSTLLGEITSATAPTGTDFSGFTWA